jgi:hypothetical protein
MSKDRGIGVIGYQDVVQYSYVLGNGDGSFQPPAYYGVALLPRSATVADFNGDGQPDLAITNFTSNSVTVLLNTAGGGLKKSSYRLAK